MKGLFSAHTLHSGNLAGHVLQWIGEQLVSVPGRHRHGTDFAVGAVLWIDCSDEDSSEHIRHVAKTLDVSSDRLARLIHVYKPSTLSQLKRILTLIPVGRRHFSRPNVPSPHHPLPLSVEPVRSLYERADFEFGGGRGRPASLNVFDAKRFDLNQTEWVSSLGGGVLKRIQCTDSLKPTSLVPVVILSNIDRMFPASVSSDARCQQNLKDMMVHLKAWSQQARIIGVLSPEENRSPGWFSEIWVRWSDKWSLDQWAETDDLQVVNA